MSKKGSGRSYLQQLAQPVVPGATVLTARPVPTARVVEAESLVPVIEDSFDMPDGAPLTRPHARVRTERAAPESMPLSTGVEMAAPPEQSAVTRKQPANELPRVPGHVRDFRRERAESRPHAFPASPSGERAEAATSPVASTASPRVRSSREESSVEEAARVESKRVHSDRREPVAARVDRSLRGEEARVEVRAARRRPEPTSAVRMESDPVQAPSAAKGSARERPSQTARQDDTTERKEVQRANEGASALQSPQLAVERKALKPEVGTSEGPRVHIGTVEIRAVLPQPVVPQPAMSAQNVPQNVAGAQARGRSGAAEPLARGLDWSYGLVQG